MNEDHPSVTDAEPPLVYALGYQTAPAYSSEFFVRALALFLALTRAASLASMLMWVGFIWLQQYFALRPALTAIDEPALYAFQALFEVVTLAAAIGMFQLRPAARQLLVFCLGVEILLTVGSFAYRLVESWGQDRWHHAYWFVIGANALTTNVLPGFFWWLFRQPGVVACFRSPQRA